jgi:hypothetical protein
VALQHVSVSTPGSHCSPLSSRPLPQSGVGLAVPWALARQETVSKKLVAALMEAGENV